MLPVTVLCRGLPIGRAELTALDPPMGVAGGRFEPGPGYAHVRPEIVAATRDPAADWEALGLSVATEDGVALHAIGGVTLMDADDPAEPPAIDVAGIDVPPETYARWFGDDPAYRAYYGLGSGSAPA